MHIERAELQMLAEIGFMAATRGDRARAETIFNLLRLARPESAAAYVGGAMACLFGGKASEALLVLDRGLLIVAPDARAELHAFRALVLQCAGRASECSGALRLAGDEPLARKLRGEQDAVKEET